MFLDKMHQQVGFPQKEQKFLLSSHVLFVVLSFLSLSLSFPKINAWNIKYLCKAAKMEWLQLLLLVRKHKVLTRKKGPLHTDAMVIRMDILTPYNYLKHGFLKNRCLQLNQYIRIDSTRRKEKPFSFNKWFRNKMLHVLYFRYGMRLKNTVGLAQLLILL